jgi:hypothetical protein
MQNRSIDPPKKDKKKDKKDKKDADAPKTNFSGGTKQPAAK